MPLDKPQRLIPPAAPGVLLKRPFEIVKRMRLKEATAREPTYLALVRQLPCLKCGMEPPPSNEAAHVSMTSAAHGKSRALGKKVPDRFVVPLCAHCHTRDNDSQHEVGEALFWSRVGINPLLVCEQLYAKRSDLVAMRAVIYCAIAERESSAQVVGLRRTDP